MVILSYPLKLPRHVAVAAEAKALGRDLPALCGPWGFRDLEGCEHFRFQVLLSYWKLIKIPCPLYNPMEDMTFGGARTQDSGRVISPASLVYLAGRGLENLPRPGPGFRMLTPGLACH